MKERSRDCCRCSSAGLPVGFMVHLVTIHGLSVCGPCGKDPDTALRF